MAMDFPDSPVVGQTFSSGSRIWVWTGTTWDSPAAGTPGIVSSTGGTFTGDITAPNYAGKGNAIINGAFDIWQRGTSITGAIGTYSADRWVESSGASIVHTRSTDVPPNQGFNYSMSMAGNNANATQRIESLQASAFAGQTVTLSFWYKSTASAFRLDFALAYANSVDNFSSTTTIDSVQTISTPSTDWAKVSYTFTSIPSNAANGLAVFILRGPGASSTTLITGVQLELGSVATPFKRNANSIQGELAACQRYYWRGQTGSIFAYYGVGLAESATIGIAFVQPPVPMRSTASMSLDFSTLATYDGTTIRGITALTISQATTTGLALQATVASGQTANRPLFLINNNTAAGFLGISAEL